MTNSVQKFISWQNYIQEVNDIDSLPRIFDMIDDEIILTPSDISELLRVHVETPRRWCREGKIRTISPIGRYKVKGGDLKDFLFKWYRKRWLNNEKD